jgi:hypothetical protein
MQWLTEPLCILPPESDEAAQAIAAGCRDPFGFVPIRVAATVPIEIGAPSTIDLLDLPAADVMVGDLTSRVAYASLVFYDDRDGDGTLQLARPHRAPNPDGPDGEPDDEEADPTDSPDVVYGASFATMTAPDQRIVFREGAFNAAAAFYPRSGCGEPPPAFSVVAAGGFTAEAALAASAMGQLPAEDPATCWEAAPGDVTIAIAARPPAEVREVSCNERRADGSVRYFEPPTEAPDLDGRILACAHLPAFGTADPSGAIQLLATGRATDRCVGLTHYVLRGCREGGDCEVPDWDYTTNPPAWWPCPR